MEPVVLVFRAGHQELNSKQGCEEINDEADGLSRQARIIIANNRIFEIGYDIPRILCPGAP